MPIVRLNPDHRGTEFFASLEGMRGIAALGVLLYHVFWKWRVLRNPLIAHGMLFVDFFFVISGFVICHIYSTRLKDRPSLGEFFLLRTARLYPLHLFTLLVVTAMLLTFHWIGHQWASLHFLSQDGSLTGTPTGFIRNLLLVQNITFHPGFPFNRPSWSISTEYYTYLVFAIAAIVTSGRRYLLVSISLVVILATGTHLWQSGALVRPGQWGPIPLSNAFLRCLLGFFTGVILQFIWQFIHPRARMFLGKGWRSHLIETASLVFVVIAMWHFGGGRRQFFVLLSFASMVLAFTVSRGWFTTLLETRHIQKLGKWSYSIYLTHFIILVFFTDTLHVLLQGKTTLSLLPWWESWPIVALLVGVVLVVSSLTYRFIEVPPRGWAKHFVASRHSLRTAPASADRTF